MDLADSIVGQAARPPSEDALRPAHPQLGMIWNIASSGNSKLPSGPLSYTREKYRHQENLFEDTKIGYASNLSSFYCFEKTDLCKSQDIDQFPRSQQMLC